MIYYNQKGGEQVSKKKKRKKRIQKSLELLINLMIAIGTILTGIATLIQALK